MPASRGALAGELVRIAELAQRRLVETSNRIRVAREAANVSRTDLANLLGVVHMSVYRYETAKRPLSLELIERIAFHLGVSADWLLTGKGPMHVEAAA